MNTVGEAAQREKTEIGLGKGWPLCQMGKPKTWAMYVGAEMVWGEGPLGGTTFIQYSSTGESRD